MLYEWNVHTTKRWMNAMAPLLRPVFEWNHNWVMRNGGAGIAELLGVPAAGVGLTDLSLHGLDT